MIIRATLFVTVFHSIHSSNGRTHRATVRGITNIAPLPLLETLDVAMDPRSESLHESDPCVVEREGATRQLYRSSSGISDGGLATMEEEVTMSKGKQKETNSPTVKEEMLQLSLSPAPATLVSYFTVIKYSIPESLDRYKKIRTIAPPVVLLELCCTVTVVPLPSTCGVSILRWTMSMFHRDFGSVPRVSCKE